MTQRTDTVYLIALVVILFGSGCRSDDPVQSGPSPKQKFELSDFQSAEACSTCHPRYFDEWQGSMHRYATNDPIWMLASNSLQESTNGQLKSWCIQCHSPIGFLTESVPPTFQIESLPAIVREGVNCDVCHILRPPYTTTEDHAVYTISPGSTKYGTLPDPLPTIHGSAYEPSYGRSEVCRICHDLIRNNVPVEITFTEWQQSPWGAMSYECQDCHMKTYTGQAAVNGPVRQNLHQHDFVGVDLPITPFPNKERQRAGVDSLLKNSASMSVLAPTHVATGDSFHLSVTITNDKTGHNLPTSVFFFRQMWIEVLVWNGPDTVYRSGHLDANRDLMDGNSTLGPGADKDLTIFNGVLYKNHAESNVFELDSLVNRSLAPFASHTSVYSADLPHVGSWNYRVRLLFRPFGPYLFRALGAGSFVGEIPIYEMLSEEGVVIAH